MGSTAGTCEKILENKSDASSVLPSSNHEATTETIDNPNTALAREQLRPYVEIAAFREYLKEQIIKWEVWHQSQVDEIRMHESCRDRDKVLLENGIHKGTVDPDDIYVLSYEWHKSEVSSIPMDLEFRLVAEREPICFQEASIAAMVALFWCDINRSNRLVPDYDRQPGFCFLEPYGTFQKYLFEQWEKPLQERYKHIDWFVEAAINAYKSRTDVGSDNTSEQRESRGAPTHDSTTSKCSLEQCEPAERKAYYSFKLAEAEQGKRLEDRVAYDLLVNGDWSEQFTNELTDYELPAFATWARQLRTARKATNERKYTPRTHK